jgi:glutathione synthase
MQHIFIIDPFEGLKPNHDSSLALMKAALLKKHSVWQAELHDINWSENSLIISTKLILLENNKLVVSDESKRFNLSRKSEFPWLLVWMRKDPPIDEKYIRACQLLRLSVFPVINNPNSLLNCDEKLFALEFPDLIPKTHITQDINEIKNLVLEKEILIAKPIGGKAGEGILALKAEDKNLSSLIELMTEQGNKSIIVQEYLAKATEGDKRIFLLAGEPIGALLRIPRADDYRANMAAGGSVAKTSLSAKDLEICQKLKPRLLELKLNLVGLDIIDEKLTEINITSPTCLEEISELNNSDLAKQIINWSENLATS